MLGTSHHDYWAVGLSVDLCPQWVMEACWHLLRDLMGGRLMTLCSSSGSLCCLKQWFQLWLLLFSCSQKTGSLSVAACVLIPPGVPAAQPTYPRPSEYLSRGYFDVHHTSRSMPLSFCLITSPKGKWLHVYELSFLLVFCGYFMGFVVLGISCRN